MAVDPGTATLIAAGNANDDSAGTGTREIMLEGLDSNWAVATEALATNGTSASSATSTSFIRLNRAYITVSGTYHGQNAGDIVIETSGGIVVGNIGAGLGQTELALYSVPAGKTAYLLYAKFQVEGNKSADCMIYQYQNADDTATPFSGGRRVIVPLPGVEGEAVEEFKQLVSVPEKTDIWSSGITSAGTVGIYCSFDLVLVDD